MPVSVLSNLGNGMFVVFFNNKPDTTCKTSITLNEIEIQIRLSNDVSIIQEFKKSSTKLLETDKSFYNSILGVG